MSSFVFIFCTLLSAFYSCDLCAQGIGNVAANINEPIRVIINLVQAVSIICGTGLLLGGILRYIDYRRNPVAVRLGTVFFMFLFGAALVVVGLIPLHTVAT